MSEERWNELRARLSLMLDHLDRREKFIIRARFSLADTEKYKRCNGWRISWVFPKSEFAIGKTCTRQTSVHDSVRSSS